MSDQIEPEPDIERDGVVRSEERLDVTTRQVPIGKAVLRKVVVVEQRTITVDVAHEEATLEFVELDERAAAGSDAARGAHAALPDLLLYREEVTVTKRLVPTERIRVELTTVHEEQDVVEDLRHEEIEMTGDGTGVVDEKNGRS